MFKPIATPTAAVHQTVAAVVKPLGESLLLLVMIPAPRNPIPTITLATILEAALVLVKCSPIAVNNRAPTHTAA